VVVPPLLPPQGAFRSESPSSSRSSSPERFATPPGSSSSEERFQPSTPDPLALTPPSQIQVRLQELDDRVRSELDPFHSPQFARFAAQPSAPTLPKVTLPPAPAAVRPSAVFGHSCRCSPLPDLNQPRLPRSGDPPSLEVLRSLGPQRVGNRPLARSPPRVLQPTCSVLPLCSLRRPRPFSTHLRQSDNPVRFCQQSPYQCPR
jgi:hypothetical protein